MIVLKLCFLSTHHNPISLCIYENTMKAEAHSDFAFSQELEAWVDTPGFSILKGSFHQYGTGTKEWSINTCLQVLWEK